MGLFRQEHLSIMYLMDSPLSCFLSGFTLCIEDGALVVEKLKARATLIKSSVVVVPNPDIYISIPGCVPRRSRRSDTPVVSDVSVSRLHPFEYEKNRG